MAIFNSYVTNFQRVYIYIWLVVSNIAGLFSISYMGCHPEAIDELHHFSEG